MNASPAGGHAPPSPLALDLNGERAAGEAWGNLGLWAPGDAYGEAAARLARRVGAAAALGPGQRVLELGCGTGQAMRLWHETFGVAAVVGCEPDPVAAAFAGERCDARDRVHAAPAAAAARRLPPDSIDAVVAVDAAYHFEHRRALLDALARVLRPGARAAWTDLVLDRGPARPGPVLRALLRSAAIPHGNLLTESAYGEALAAAGWRDVRLERLDAAVLDGFARWWPAYRRRHRVRTRLWLRAELTARMLAANRRTRRLGYLIASARPPERGA
ncbi:MAG: class I SAM-dependent methyltransferase [Pseudomonadales bacterium]|nr:class I SAM-dependent methyltransferase [Pseudomonadales bacterium]